MATKQSTRTTKRKPAAHIDWFKKGEDNAQVYWANMEKDPENEHLAGHLAVLCEQVEEERRNDPSLPSKYINGFAEGVQKRIEAFLSRGVPDSEDLDTAIGKALGIAMALSERGADEHDSYAADAIVDYLYEAKGMLKGEEAAS